MADALLNWAVMLASFAVLLLVAFLAFRDLRSYGETSAGARKVAPVAWDAEPEPLEEETPEEAGHRLRAEYFRNGRSERVQWVGEAKPGYIGTEVLPGMGSGILVRHVRLSYDGGGFAMENRHSSQPLAWSVDGDSGELAPGESAPIRGEMEIYLGEWAISLREETT